MRFMTNLSSIACKKITQLINICLPMKGLQNIYIICCKFDHVYHETEGKMNLSFFMYLHSVATNISTTLTTCQLKCDNYWCYNIFCCHVLWREISLHTKVKKFKPTWANKDIICYRKHGTNITVNKWLNKCY